MKHFFLFFMLFLGILACKKDTDDIQNDLCKGIICKNGGNCVNGDCNCPPQWTGPDCSQQKTPSSLKIQSITVTSFPPTDNGAGWDLTSGPDVYIAIWQGSTLLYDNKASFVQNATGSVSFNVNFTLPSVGGSYTIAVYDFDDFDADDYMGGITGSFYNSTNGFPNTLTMSCAGCAVSFSVPVVYTFL